MKSIDTEDTDYEGDFGGGAEDVYAWLVVAHDCAGNTAQQEISAHMTVVQQDGRDPGGRDTGTVSHSGNWVSETAGYFLADSAQRSSEMGAAITYTDNVSDKTGSAAVVMSRGPARGQADIYVDGTFRTTIDTRASANDNRIAVWQARLTSGMHSITVVNKATPGRARVDVDALMLD